MEAGEYPPQQGEIVIGFEAAAGSVRGPFMLDKRGSGHNIEQRIWVGWAGRIAAVLRASVGAVILRPEPVDNEAQVFGAFGAVWARVAEFRRPGEGEEVVVEFSGLLGWGGVRGETKQEDGEADRSHGCEF